MTGMIYRVVDTSIGRLFGVFETEEDALNLVRDLIEANDPSWVDDLAVGWERPDGSFGEPLSGAALLARLDAVLAQPR